MRPAIIFNLFIWLFLAFNNPHQAFAERVFIKTEKGEQGQGWLFGAKERGNQIQCWIALPAHVAGQREGFSDNSLHQFTFQTNKGKQGVSGKPVAVSENETASTLLGQDFDLAFAKVSSGFRNGECYSRLGLPSFVYDVVSKQELFLDTVSVSQDIFSVFKMKLSRSGRADFKYYQILKPLSDQDKSYYLKGGFSGATATFDYQGHSHPFAMITSVNTTNSTTKAIRFDAIQKAFDPIRTQINLEQDYSLASKSKSLPYRVVNYEGKFDQVKSLPSLLLEQDSCWEMSPLGGKKIVRLSIEPKKQVSISSIIFKRASSCVPDDTQIGVDISYDKGKSWIRRSDCFLAKNALETECRLNLSKPTSIRITAIGRVFSLSELQLLP